MSASVYEAVAFAMRYWFVIALAVILIAVILISVKEYRSRKRAFSIMNAFSGYLEIVAGPEDMLGEKFGICEENIIGSGRNSDIVIDDYSVEKIHASLHVEDGELFLSPLNGAESFVNGYEITGKTNLKTGDLVGVGDIDMRLYIKRKRVGDDY